MKMKNNKPIEAFDKFINSLNIKDRIAVIHHTDPDGVCSGVIAAKLVERSRNKKIDLRLNQESGQISITDKTVALLKKKKINKVIITDMAVDQHSKSIYSIANFAEVLIIDHHKIYHEFKSNKITIIKPQMIYEGIEPVLYCTSKLVFDLGKRLVDLSDLDWIASLGIIGDCGYSFWKTFINKTLRKYGIEKKDDVFKTELGRTSNRLSETESFSTDKVKEAFEIVYKSKNHRDVLNSKLDQYSRKIRKDKDHWMKNFEKLAEFHKDVGLVFYRINPKYNVKISTLLSLKHPHTTIIVISEDKKMLNLSARRQDKKVKVNDLLENAVKGLKEATAGGHIPAAGGKILRKDLEKFKKNVIMLLKKK